jgi:hypothetical protein
MSEKGVQIFINKKEILYTHSNIVQAINAFLPYLTNPDLDDLHDKCDKMKEDRRQKEALSRIEVKKHSWPYPDTINKHDT